MEDMLRHNCGILVVHSIDDLVNLGPFIQHRGREAAGIFAKSNDRIDVLKWVGSIDVFDKDTISQIFSRDRKYHTYGLHVRYATRGRKDMILEDAHPHVIGGKRHNLGNHIFIEDCDAAIIHNGQVGGEIFKDIDPSCLLTGCDSELLLHYYKKFGEKKILENIPGSYTLAIADKNRDEVIVLRDQLGMKPGVLGFKNNKTIVASENSLFFDKKYESEFDHDLKPGAAYYIQSDGNYTREIVVSNPRRQYCFFEYNYVAMKYSVINHLSVFEMRNSFGEMLSRLVDTKMFDYVTYVPKTPRPAARRISMITGLPFIKAFYKPKGDIRTFLGSTEEERALLSKEHIFPSVEHYPTGPKPVKGKSVLEIDDSIIRGNNARRIRDLNKILGIKYALIASYTPKIGIMGSDGIARGCLYGVDMPPDDNFLVRPRIDGISTKFNRTDKEINKALGIDVYFAPVDEMLKVFEKNGMPREKLCHYCIGGPKPF